MTHVLITLFIGFFVGLIARLLYKKQSHMGFWLTTLLGIAGAWFAKTIGLLLDFYQEGDSVGWLMSILGAVLLLMIFQTIFKQRHRNGL